MTAREWTLPLTITAPLSMNGREPEVFWGLQRDHVDCPVVLEISMDGDPASKSRARFTGFGSKTRAYTPAKTKAAEEAWAARVRTELPAWVVDGDGSYGILAVFFAATFQRRDVDNMLKLVSDALTGVIWTDDAQVSEMSARVVRGDGFPRTHLRIYRTIASQKPTKDCPECGTTFTAYASQAKKVYCSGACFQASRRKAREVACKTCGTAFVGARGATYCSVACKSTDLTTELICGYCNRVSRMPQSVAKTRKFCSAVCASRAAAERRTVRAAGTCDTCGGSTSKKQYRQCRSCKYAAVDLGAQVDVEDDGCDVDPWDVA